MKNVYLASICFFLLGMSSILISQPDQSEQPIQIVEGKNFSYAYMDFGGSFDNMEKNIGVFMGEFFKQGLTPAGPIIGVYYNDPREVKPDDLKWGVGFIVSKDIKVKEPLKMGEFNGKTAAYYLYTRPYEKMDNAYETIFKFTNDKGYEVIWPVFDQYLNNPKQVKPEELKTQIIIPLKKSD